MTTETKHDGYAARWIIWSNEHHLFWRPNSQGYTRHIEQAGRYTEYEADQICHNPHLNDGDVPDEMKFLAPDAIQALTEEKERLQRRIAEFQKEVCELGVQRDEAEGEVKALERECWEATATNVKLRMALTEALKTLKQSRNFIAWREKMHPDGVALYDEAIAHVEAALCPQPEPQDND